MEPAENAGKGNWHTATYVDVSVPVGQILDLADTAIDVAKAGNESGELTDAQVRELSDSVAGLVLAPPTIGPRVLARYGLSDEWEIGGRLAPGNVRAEGRWQFLGTPGTPGIKGSVGLGLGYFEWSVDLPDEVRNVVELDEYGATS